ncbi:PepSY domain-containing protein [Runella slithyformis]|uniref:NADPH--hemoprotein reductase n=1 Tax=Runella slithyformis (strain ATCC 29530 / DSM 19594 / LMG 11500 / NCIMB 11436 / LSU 4) TaxID=761193 RepID=A0A7U3ZPH8_RUNSL|nr:PepSY domain-containing protein [Runella slithyformis]AEI50980.1 flavodoxin/nitric oxide synthase [Runella slithyformis DSM 19594]
MTEFWRRLHFASTVVAGLFIFSASVTGCILALEPWFISQNAVSGQSKSDVTLAEFQEKLNENFLEVFSFEKDAYGNIKVEGVGLEKEGTLFVNVETGKIVTTPKSLHPVFDLSRDLHRSLFLKTPGRILMGLASLALVFLAVSGIGLHIKRAGGLKALFKSVKILEIKRDGHAQWSRLFLIPILVVAVSGTYLSIVRFSPVSSSGVSASAATTIPFDKILLPEVKKVNYPVMDDEPLVVELSDRNLHFDKTKGRLIKTELLPVRERMRVVNFILHTGEGTKGWAGVLWLTSLVMVFLSFTGFQMVMDKLRLKKHKAALADDAEIIILVGSETGHTWRFADALEEAYQNLGIKVGTLGMEHFPKLNGKKTVLFLTSTYGNGDAPQNAQNIIEQLEEKMSFAEAIQFSVLGFGSRQYPAFCAFAEQFRNHIVPLGNAREIVPYMTVDNQSAVQFIDWVRALNRSQKITLSINTKHLHPVRKKGLETFTILEKKENEDTFLLRITHAEKLKIHSGDLLGVYPPNENIERFYSIASVSPTELLLVIKRTGLCSNFLGSLSVGDYFEAFVKRNPSFYCPNHHTPVLMIANGTGIAPFLGMQSSGSKLFWGGKFQADFKLFEKYCFADNRYLVFSRENDNAYVQDLLLRRESEVAEVLKENGTIMICGSRTMLKGVLETIEKITASNALPSTEELRKQHRLLTDCY